MPSRMASSPRFIPPYEPEIPMRSRLVTCSTMFSNRLERRPRKLNPFFAKKSLEFVEKVERASDLPRQYFSPDAECRQQAGRLADVPFHRVHSKRAICDVCDSEIFASG